MAKFKKIIPALCMLVVSAIMAVSTTYAWFSMNKTVTATGMEVTAKSDSVYLQIVNEDNSAADTNKTTANGKTSTATIYPAKWNGSSAAEKWQYAVAAAPSASEKTGDYIDVADANKSDYRLANTFKVSMTNETAEGKNLKVKTCKVTGTSAFLDAIGVVVVCGNEVQTISAKGKTSGTAFDIESAEILATTVTNTETSISVYVYIDGDNTNVYTNNLTKANVTGISVELTFGID